MSYFARAIINLTIVAPIVFAAVLSYASDIKSFIIHFGLGLFVLCTICVGITGWYIRWLKKQSLEQCTFVKAVPCNNSVLIFIIVYTIPILSGDVIGLYRMLGIILLCFLALFFINVITDSPFLRILGYRIYEVETEKGLGLFLLSKKTDPREILNKKVLYHRIDACTLLEGDNS